MRTAKHTLTDFLHAPTRAMLIAALAVFGMTAESRAESVLTGMDHHAGGDGRVDIRLDFDGAVPSVQAFATDEPPRIVLDLADTKNHSNTRRLAIGSGATSAVTLLEAAGKTRVVVDLFRSAAYETRSEGSSIILTVNAAVAASANQTAEAVPATRDPAKRLPNTAIATALDFKRTDDGGGQLALAFNVEGVVADLNDENGRITVHFPGVELAAGVAQRVDVTDFATPVRTTSLTAGSAGAKLEMMMSGAYESMAYQAGQDFIVEVRQLEASVAAEAIGIGVEAEKKGYSGTPVTFNFQNIPVRTVLQLIAEESGLNVVASDTVSGNVTLRLVNVPWDQALDIVLRAKSLDQRRQDNVVWVAPQAEIASYEQAIAEAKLAMEDRAELVTEYIPINYGNAEEIASLLTDETKRGQQSGGAGGSGGGQQMSSGFLSSRGSVTFDKRTNTLLLNDTVEKIVELKALIALLDRPVDQVLIEARIVVASESFARELGARFGISAGYEDSNGNILTSAGSIAGTDRMANTALSNRFNGQGSGLPVASPGPIGAGVLVPSLGERLNVNLPVIAPSGSLGFALLGADYLLDLELSALEIEGRGEVVSSPRVITANQREAIIRQGDEVGYVTISGAGGAGGVPIPTVEFKPVLLELTVTPTITQDGRVYLVMKIVKDEVSGFIDTSIGSVPQISKREISTAVLMNNAQTVVVGGVYEFESREDLNKVPFLGDVPVLGNLFRKKGRSSEKAELLVFVTPRVVPVTGPK